MTIEERIEKANAMIQKYWDMTEYAKERGNVREEEYWRYKLAAACNIYEIITGTEWKISK